MVEQNLIYHVMAKAAGLSQDAASLTAPAASDTAAVQTRHGAAIGRDTEGAAWCGASTIRPMLDNGMITRRAFVQAAASPPRQSAGSRRRARPTCVPIGFDDLYERETVLTAKLQALGRPAIEMLGFMAPPLKAEAKFFVLTRSPMAVCPFCETEMQWPDDIVLVLTDEAISAAPYNVRIRVTGRLDLGFEKDPETGFVSLIRLESAEYDRV